MDAPGEPNEKKAVASFEGGARLLALQHPHLVAEKSVAPNKGPSTPEIAPQNTKNHSNHQDRGTLPDAERLDQGGQKSNTISGRSRF